MAKKLHYLALCCIAKDEDPFLKEWLAHHSLLGVEHFYIYDNCSRVPIRQLLGPFADPQRVTIRRVPGKKMQLPVYNDCLQSFGPLCQWIGFLDLDEFARPMRDDDLRVLLSEFESYGGLGAAWRLFGSSGHLKRPDGPVLKNYTEAFALQESFQIKSFVRPERALQALNPHYFSYLPGYYCVNEDHYPISPGLQCTFSSGRLLRIHHYFLRSQQDFEEKLIRGGPARKEPLEMIMFYDGSTRPCVRDSSMHRYLPGLEKALRADRLPPVSPLLAPEVSYEQLMETALGFQGAAQPEKALACLCAAGEEHYSRADFWLLRAILAAELGQERRADIFIRQSMTLEATEAAYARLSLLLQERGEPELAANVQTIMRRYPRYFH